MGYKVTFGEEAGSEPFEPILATGCRYTGWLTGYNSSHLRGLNGNLALHVLGDIIIVAISLQERMMETLGQIIERLTSASNRQWELNNKMKEFWDLEMKLRDSEAQEIFRKMEQISAEHQELLEKLSEIIKSGEIK